MPDFWDSFDESGNYAGPGGLAASPYDQGQVQGAPGAEQGGGGLLGTLMGMPGMEGASVGGWSAGQQQAPGPQAQQGPQPFNLDAFTRRANELSAGASGSLAEFQQRILPQLQQEFQGLQGFGSKGDKIRLPDGQVIDAVVSAGLGGKGYNWGIEQPGVGQGGGAPAGPVAGLGDLGWSALGAGGAGGSSGINVGTASASPLTAAKDYNPQNVAGPERLTLGNIAQPDAVNAQQVGPGQQVSAQQVGPGERVTAGQVQGQTIGAPGQVRASQVTAPGALEARNVADPNGFQNLTEEQLQLDPSYQFRLKQGLGAMQNSAASRGILQSGATAKALQDYAGQSASQEYQAANERARQTYQQNLLNNQSVIGQNNAAQAQAYGLTNQFGQAAQLANQGANLQADQFNVNTGQQAGMFNAGQQQQANLANVGNNLQAGQFNSAQAQQAALANQGANLQAGQFNSQQGQQAALANQQANLNAGQFNAGMNFNTQQANIGNQLAAYNAYQPLYQQNQQFNAQQQAQAAQNNFQNQYNVEQGNNTNALNAFQANTSAQLGAGSLANQAAANQNSYNLGLGNLSLGNKQADQSYNLGLGGQNLGWANFGLNQQGQDFGQGLQTFNTNYGVYRDNRDTAFNQGLALSGIGQNAATNYGNTAAGLYSNTGASNANAGLAGAGAWSGALNNIGNSVQQQLYWNGMGGQ